MAKIIKKGDFMKKNSRKCIISSFLTPSLAVLSPNSINQLQMMLATFYKKISNLQQSPQEKKIWNRGFPIIRKILKKNVDTLVIVYDS